MIKGNRRCRFNLEIPKAFLCLLFTFLAGCMSMTIKDDLPPSAPKGYADFGNYSLGYDTIYSMKDGKKVKEGFLEFKGQILRVARTPGHHDFIVEHRDARHQRSSKLINVQVMQDMLTFVTLDDQIIEVTSGLIDRYETTLTTYRLNVSIAKNPAPLDFESEPDKTDTLMKLLNDSDWRARLHAVSFLKKRKGISEENLIKRAGTLATDDPNKTVREKASSLLKDREIDVSENLLLLENFESNHRRWINSRGRYDFFCNDEYLFRPTDDKCEYAILKSPLDLPRNFEVQLVSTWKSGINNDAYGLLIGSDINNFNHFGISRNGQASVRSIRNNEVAADPVPWTESSVKGHGFGRNIIRVKVSGDNWTYYINDAFVGEIVNTLKMNKYVIGLRVCGGQAIAFEQLKITQGPLN